jgi:hypothetical protein
MGFTVSLGGRMAAVSDRRPDLPNRQTPFSEAFKKFHRRGLGT